MLTSQNCSSGVSCVVANGAGWILAREDFQKEGAIFQIGAAPRQIDIITTASGLQFEET
jgi:hypothetical protein